jgi:hypothetical protein
MLIRECCVCDLRNESPFDPTEIWEDGRWHCSQKCLKTAKASGLGAKPIYTRADPTWRGGAITTGEHRAPDSAPQPQITLPNAPECA